MGKSSITVVLAACLLGLTGCAGNNAVDNNRNNISVKDVRNQNGKLVNDANTGRLRVSTKAARSVARLNEVDQAHVIIRNNDAYVAVRLKNATNNQTGTTGTTTGRTGTNTGVTGYGDNNMGTTGYGGTTGTTGMTGTGSTGHFGTNAGTIHNRGPEADIRNNVTGTGSLGSGGTNGTSGVPGTTGTTGIPGTTGTTGINGTPGTTGTTSLRGGTPGTTGTVGTTNRNAETNTADNNRYSEVSTPFEQRVADRVRAADPSIHKVYVSVDPTFYNRMNTYYNDITNGRNRDGLINDFGNTVRRFFR